MQNKLLIELVWFIPGCPQKREAVPLARRDDGTLSLRVPAARLRESGASALRVTPSFGHAEKGEAGWWFSPYGYYGEWDRDEGFFKPSADRMNMPMFGWATPRGAWLAVIESLRLYPRMVVEAKEGRYAVSCELGEELCRDPYEDFEIAFHPFPAGTGYAAVARRYRELQLARGVVRPLRERAAETPALAYAAAAPEIRIRQAWKPVPSPVPHQQPENEPPVHVAVTFDRVREISGALRAAGVEKAELCLVGWNIGGHDGRWPQSFPAEPLLGGDAALRETIRAVQADGYQIVPHGNYHSKFVTDAKNWTAQGDLSCATDADLALSVARIKEECDVWGPFARLQFEFMDGHERLAPGVFLTIWGDGTRLVTNYGPAPFPFEGRSVEPEGFALLAPSASGAPSAHLSKGGLP